MKKTAFVLLMLAVLLLSACSSGPADGSGTEIVDDSYQQEVISDNNVLEVVEPADDVFGTRNNPVPLKTKVEVGPNWNVTINEIVHDAWAEIEDENMFNDPPIEGRQFIMANIEVSYVGPESGTPWVDLSTHYLGSDNNVYGSGCDDRCGVVPNSLSDIGEQFPGAVASGNVCWSVPSDVVEGGKIIIEESLTFEDTRVFFEGVVSSNEVNGDEEGQELIGVDVGDDEIDVENEGVAEGVN